MPRSSLSLSLNVSFSILTYLSLSFSQVVRCVLALVSKTDPALAELAYQLACLHPVGIPRALFPDDEATDARLRTLFRPVAPPLRPPLGAKLDAPCRMNARERLASVAARPRALATPPARARAASGAPRGGYGVRDAACPISTG